jgi:hypothetical protein
MSVGYSNFIPAVGVYAGRLTGTTILAEDDKLWSVNGVQVGVRVIVYSSCGTTRLNGCPALSRIVTSVVLVIARSSTC